MRFATAKSGATRSYAKLYATFKCSGSECGKSWTSAHAWNREDDGVYCEFCNTRANLLNIVDEMLELDNYVCRCDNVWQSIHGGLGLLQKCDVCKSMVSPEGPPQMRFGRHYFFQCTNDNCGEKPAWEDFSTDLQNLQKSQRCTVCGNRGNILKVQKLKPFWYGRRRRGRNSKDGRGQGDGNAADDKGPSKHNSDFCDMCQDVIRQGFGRSCEKYRNVKTKLSQEASFDGRVLTLIEKIISVI